MTMLIKLVARCVCGTSTFAECVHVHHGLIVLSVELGGLEAGYDHLFMDGEVAA